MHSVESLFNLAMDLDSNASRVSPDIELQFIIYPEMILSCLKYFADISDNMIKNKKNQIFLLLNEGFTRLRYKLDNQDMHAQSLLEQLHQTLKQIFQDLDINKKMLVSNALHDSKLPTPELDYNDDALKPTAFDKLPDIAPQLPAFLDLMRREGGIKTSFELYEFLIAHMQLQPIEIQCALINELITAKKEFVYDVGVFMLLHPKKTIRCLVPFIWVRNFSENIIKISPVTLRRFIVIRNWLPHDEQQTLDKLIQQVRRKGVMPASYPALKITKLVSSIVDGAGVQCILFEAKAKNQRTIAGFLLKEGIGLREPFVIHKAHAEEFSGMIEKNELPSKSVSTAFVSKLVSHFIAVGQRYNHVPEPAFLEIAELFGMQNWLPQIINPMDEIIRIKKQTQLDTSNPTLIALSLKESGLWSMDFGLSWFEMGDRVNQAIIEAEKIHSEIKKDNSKLPLSKVATGVLLRGKLLDKWIFILIRMLLWHRSKNVKGDHWKYFLVIAELLLQRYPVEDIPLMEQITGRSFAHTIQYQGHLSSGVS